MTIIAVVVISPTVGSKSMTKHYTSSGFSKCTQIIFITLFVLTSGVLFVPVASPQTPAGADGTLDSTFGVGGKVRSDFSGQYDALSAIALQPDGKLIVAGKIYSL